MDLSTVNVHVQVYLMPNKVAGNHQKLLGMVHVGTSGVIMILCHQLMRSLRANVNTEFHLVTKTVLCKQSLVRALKLCLLKTLEGPREGFELLFTAVQQRPPIPTPSQPVHRHCPPSLPPPNRPCPIGTCYAGIQVSRRSQENCPMCDW